MKKNLIKLFLKINSFFKPKPHPFNEEIDSPNLDYSEFEFSKAPSVFEKYHCFGNFFEKIKDKKIVDFACGGGGKSIFLAIKGAQEVYGIDLDTDFINQAKNIAKKNNVESKCHFSVADAMDSNLPNNYFDFVILNDAIEHIPDTEKTLIEALRILKPGGEIYINFEGYYYFFGHHLWDALPIPWLHLFTTESFRISLYKEAVKKISNGQKRIDFRISKNNGVEHISYLNKITIKKFEKIIKKLEKKKILKIKHIYYSTFNKKIFKLLAKIPLLREMFLSTVYCVLQKSETIK
ncbi:class I SAM-dependent methyltransferase [Patescibacteria group bacterium]|nr:class I SAM-dependent methyltransferase [Patescibacteria group bacterium]